MADIQEQVNDICRLADAVVMNPSVSLSTTAVNIGVCDAVVLFASGGAMHFNVSEVNNPLYAAGIWIANKFKAAGKWIASKFKDKEKERQEEKERMLREVIRKQQAVINRLNEELARSRQQNAENRQEIENLKEMLRMLEETVEFLNVV